VAQVAPDREALTAVLAALGEVYLVCHPGVPLPWPDLDRERPRLAAAPSIPPPPLRRAALPPSDEE
jgi:hypothetical protein